MKRASAACSFRRIRRRRQAAIVYHHQQQSRRPNNRNPAVIPATKDRLRRLPTRTPRKSGLSFFLFEFSPLKPWALTLDRTSHLQAVALWKIRSMGLLPDSAEDWAPIFGGTWLGTWLLATSTSTPARLPLEIKVVPPAAAMQAVPPPPT